MLTRREFDEIETCFYWMEEDVMAKDEILKYLKNNYVIGTSTFSSEAPDRTASCMRNITNETVSHVYKECYVPSRETKEECWERMNGHQRCCQAEADAARKGHNNKDYDLEKKLYETMFSCADHRKTVEELEDNIKYLKERITGGEDSEKKFEQLCDLLEKSKTDLENGTKVHELKTGNMTAETINIKRIEDLEEIVSVLCCVVLEMGRPSYNNLQNDIGRLKYVLAKKGK